MTFSLNAIFRKSEQYEGVRSINIHLLRLAWCVWAAFATLAGLGILRPLKMLPILLLEIFYKVLWPIIVAYPLWSQPYRGGTCS